MRRFASLAFALVAAASPLAAQGAHPSFSGTWTLDPSGAPASAMTPSSMTVVIVQTDKTINVSSDAVTTMGPQKASQVINLDGSPTKNPVDAGGGNTIDLTSTAAWDGPSLVVTTKAEVQGQTLQQIDRWTLDADGKTLKMARGLSIAGQSMDMSLVFKKS